MSPSPSPHEPLRASRYPCRPYASSTPKPRHRRSRSPSRRHAHHRRAVSTSSSHHSRTSSSDNSPPPGPRPSRLVVCPGLAGALPLGEVGRGSGKSRRGAHGAHLRGDPHPHPRQPQRGRPRGDHAAGSMESPPPGRGPGPPPPLHLQSSQPVSPHHPPRGLGHRRPTGPPPTPLPQHWERKGHWQGEGKGRDGTPRQESKEGPKVTGRRPPGQGTRIDTGREQETTHGPGRGKNRDRGAGKEDTTAGTRAHMQEGQAATEGPAPPHPQRTPHDPRRRPPPTHAAAARIERRTNDTGSRPPATRNHTGEGGHNYTARKGYGHRRGRREHHRAARHHALTARRRPRPQQGPPQRHQKRKRARPQRPGLEARTPRRHGTKAQSPREVKPSDTSQTHQPGQHTQTPTARTQRANPHLTAPPSHQPATLRPALRTTTRAGLTSTDRPRPNTRQHSTMHRSAPPFKALGQGTPRRNTP